ncbi:hypothetical protein LOD99_3809 [Oopsacas minuta]|uniref:AMP-activated protein kinase glycogen-binding domain-containing protein n=1 Tax=Oopsacas minuta TaxID=111878 RepID=A0AAV7JXT7_9METZ|nr:hypothetical protein LOD99_3809 [Oopsacas minuta]
MSKLVYQSSVFLVYTIPTKSVKFVYNKGDNSWKKLSKWYVGEKMDEDEQTIVTTRLVEPETSRTSSPKPPLRRFSSSEVDYSIPLYRSMTPMATKMPSITRKDSWPSLSKSNLLIGPSSLVKTYSRSSENILETLEEVKSKPMSGSFEDLSRRQERVIRITEPISEEINQTETSGQTSSLLSPHSPELPSSSRRSTTSPDLTPSEDRSTQVFEFKSDYWYTCLFVYHTKQKSNNVSLVGEFNGWDINAHKMHPCPEGYARCVDLQEGRYEYKFQINGNFVNDSYNHFNSQYFNNSIIFVNTDSANEHPTAPPSPPLLEYTRENASFFYFQIHTPVINDSVGKFGVVERPVYVYLPPGYSNESKSFPVVYAMDGQSMFSSSVYGWHLDRMFDDLWMKKKIKEFIFVAVPNGDDIQPGHRIREYCPRDFHQSNAFLDYMVQIVKPYIDNNFRTISNADNSFVLGSSLGGLFAFYLTTLRPEIFSGAICMAPSFWYHDVNDQSVFDVIEESRNVAPKFRVYIDSGTGEEDNFYVTRSMAESLGDLNWIPEKDFFYQVDYSTPIECDGHFTTHHHKLWRERIPDALKFMLDPNFV